MKGRNTHSTAPPPHAAILVGVCLEGMAMEETVAHLDELEELCRTRGIVTVERVIQRRRGFDVSTKIGKGKVEEIGAVVQGGKVDSVLFDDQLTPGQVKNLERMLGCKVWDRTLLILEIFALHARTVQARTQVALAQYRYLLPRLTRMWSHLSRQGGGKGAGMQGTGEKELETDRRIVQRKIHLLEGKLAVINRQAAVRRKQRGRYPKVALVGYTNAGKSTLMRRLVKEDVLVEDKLFATLTTTVRKVVVGGIPFLLADTVGFIRKLPHTLVQCFKSTLAEVCEADVLVHVVDGSHGQWTHHVEVVEETLREIGASHIPMILVFNKMDRLVEEEKRAFDSTARAYAEQHGVPVVCMSAKHGEKMEELRKVLYRKIAVVYQHRYPQNAALTSGPVVQWTE